jgi:uncharacterized OB-fold protein
MPEPAAPAAGAAGRLVTFTVIRKAPAAFAEDGVYAVAVVDLDAGGRAVGRLEPFEPPPPLGARVILARLHRGTPVFTSA